MRRYERQGGRFLALAAAWAVILAGLALARCAGLVELEGMPERGEGPAAQR